MVRIAVLLTLCVCTFQQKSKYSLKIGLLMPLNNPDLVLHSSFPRAAGAAGLAIDKLEADNILPDVNLTITWYFDECNQILSTGYAVKLIEEDKVDVIIGPTCGPCTINVGVLAKYYNIPMVTWTVATSALTDEIRFPTVNMMNGDSYTMALALVKVLKQNEWTEFAYVANVATALGKCDNLQADLENVLANTDNLLVSYKKIFNMNDSEIQATLKNVSQRARIVVACLESVAFKRQFLLNVRSMGMDTDDYVYLLLDTDATGFYLLREKIYPLYTEVDKPDGRDEDAKTAAKRAFTIDFELADAQSVALFRSQVLPRIRGWPFYCTNLCDFNDTTASEFEKYASFQTVVVPSRTLFFQPSYFSRHLYYSILMYAMTINKTLGLGQIDQLRNGTQFNVNSRGVSFPGIGATTIRINEVGNRAARAYLTGLDATDNITIFATVSVNRTSGNITYSSRFDDDSTSIWATRGGQRPLAIPICGFSGKNCPKEFWKENLVYVIIGAILTGFAIFVLVAVAFFIIRMKQKQLERLNLAWQISSDRLRRVDNDKKKQLESQRSLQSQNSSTTSTGASIEQKRDGSKYMFYYFEDKLVTVEKHFVRLTLNADDHTQLRQMCKLDHDNVNRFFGLSADLEMLISVWRHCSRGSLADVIAKGQLTLDSFIVSMIMREMAEGLNALHRSLLTCHGHLTSKNVLVDERWKIKISQYGLHAIRDLEPYTEEEMLWTAPEILRNRGIGRSQEGDVYSFAIICSEIVSCQPPFNYTELNESVSDILERVREGRRIPWRPTLTVHGDIEINSAVLHLIRDCWCETPNERPAMDTVRSLLNSMTNTGNKNLMDHVFSVLEQYAGNLEEEVNERMKELIEEKKKIDVLLYRLLPRQVAEKLKLGLPVEPEIFETVTIFLSDVVSFTTLAGKCTPLQVVNLLNDIYTAFDSVIEEHDVYKVETIGDGYLCVSGLPHRNGNEHARQIADMALAFLRSTASFRIPHLPSERIQLRIGIHTGSCIAGVVGVTMPRYCLFGDNVNIASRMESGGKPGQIHISAETNHYLRNIIGGYMTEARGETIVKGQGVLQTYWLLGKMTEDISTSPKPAMWAEFRDRNF